MFCRRTATSLSNIKLFHLNVFRKYGVFQSMYVPGNNKVRHFGSAHLLDVRNDRSILFHYWDLDSFLVNYLDTHKQQTCNIKRSIFYLQ